MEGVIVPEEFDIENDYGLFISSLSQKLANHPDHESNVKKYGSLISSHPLLPKQNPVQPERWMGITLSTLVPNNEKRHTTLAVRGDNVYLLGFRNQNGKWYEFGKETALDMNRQHNASHFLTGSTFLGFSSCYYELVGSSGWTDKKLGMISAREAVYELSKYNGKGRKIKLSLAKLIVMVCESARMFSYRKTVGTGWGLNTQITLTDMNQIGYLNNWENMSQAMMGWAEFTPGLRKIGIEGLEHAREVVHLILNSPKKGRKVPAVYDDPDDGRPEDGNDPSSRPGDGDGNGHPSLPGGSVGRPSHQGNDKDRLSHHGGVDGHASNQGDGNGHQPQPTDGNEDCRLQQHVDRCQTLVEVFTLGTANSKIPFLGSITVFDGRHGQIIFWNEEKGGADSKGNFVLTGPYRGISADGRVALKIIRMAEAEAEPDVLIWDPYTEARYPYDEIITKDIPRDLKLTYAVLSSAVEANVQVDVFLFEEITVYGEITACVNLASGEVATVVLLGSGVHGKVEPVSAGSRIPLARSVLVWPVGSSLLINVECFHPVTVHEGTSSSASATIPLLFSFEHYTAKVRFKTLEGIGYVRVSVDDTREYRDEPNNSLPRSLTNEVIKENMEMSVETGSLVVHPSQLHFTLHPNKIMSCLLHLTNKSYDDYIAFRCRPGQGILKLSGILPPDSKSTYLVRTESPLTPNIGTFTITLQSCVVPEEQEDEEDVERIMETSDGMEPIVLIAKVRFSADEMTTTSEEMENTMLNKPQHTSGTTSQFKFELLKRITNNFSEESIIGSGAYGVVYKGVMDNGQEIAVKKLNYMTQDHDSEIFFQNECTNLMRIQHPNIVRLVGYCYQTYYEPIMYDGKYVLGQRNERAFCFEYLEGGSLDQYVNEKPCRLDWDTCYTIIKGVCKGLDHLHNYSIFHLDIKPANILLDTSKMPKIGDFGLSRLFSSTKTSITKTTLGTPGYAPPEYVDKNEISPKYDVFSLGVLMIHIMAGRDLYNDYFGTPSKIIELVCENWKERLHETMWSRASQEVMTCIEIALTCVNYNRQERPTISKIVDDLDRLDIAKISLRQEATNLQSREPLVYNQSTISVSMGVHDNTTESDSMEGIENKRAVFDEVGGNDVSMHDPMDSVHDSSNSIMRNQPSHAIGGHASGAISEPRDVTQTTEVDIDGLHWRNPYLSQSSETMKFLTESGGATENAGPTYRNVLAKDAGLTQSPAGLDSCWDLFRASVDKYPSNPMLGTRTVVDGNAGDYVWMTYKEAYEVVMKLVASMSKSGVNQGERAGIYGANCSEWIISMEACHALGVCCVPLYDTLGANAVEFITCHAELQIAFVEERKIGELLKTCHATSKYLKSIVSFGGVTNDQKEEAKNHGLSIFSWEEFLIMGGDHHVDLPEKKKSDICTIMYTSGTTGDPKGVMISNESILINLTGADSVIQSIGEVFDENDVYMSYLPLAHIFDRMFEEVFIAHGAKIGFWRGDVKLLVDDIAALKPTVFCAVPRVLDRIYSGLTTKIASGGLLKKTLFNVAYKLKLDCMKKGIKHEKASPLFDKLVFSKVKERLGGKLRIIISGGAPLSVAVEEFFRVVTCAYVVQGYGLTETCAGTFVALPNDFSMVGTVGPPLPHTEVRLESVSEMGYDALSSIPRGEVCVKGGILFSGYYKREDLTQEVMTDGWFHTGDVGEWQPNGALKIIDRKKNIFKLSQGEYVAVENLENIYGVLPEIDSIWVYGNSFESSLIAVINPNQQAVEHWAEQNGISGSFAELCENSKIKEHFLAELSKIAKEKKLKGFEFIRAIHLDSLPFDMERDLITPTYKKKRPQMLKYYQGTIDALYKSMK